MTFDREPDLDNANVGMPVKLGVDSRKQPFWGFRFLFEKVEP